MKTISFTCEYCRTEYTVDAKFSEAVENQKKLGYCKACKRKDPDVPTTFEMDGLITREDILDRHTVMLQCRLCKKWTRHNDYMITKKYVPCSECGKKSYDPSSMKSIRTYNPTLDNKRKVK